MNSPTQWYQIRGIQTFVAEGYGMKSHTSISFYDDMITTDMARLKDRLKDLRRTREDVRLLDIHPVHDGESIAPDTILKFQSPPSYLQNMTVLK